MSLSTIRQSDEGIYQIETESGSVYKIFLINNQKSLERVNNNFNMRRDNDIIKIQEFNDVIVGKRALFVLEPLGLGNATFRYKALLKRLLN